MILTIQSGLATFLGCQEQLKKSLYKLFGFNQPSGVLNEKRRKKNCHKLKNT